MTTAAQALAAVTASARTHKNPKTRMVTKEATLPVGNTIRQGDVMITRHALGTVFANCTATTNRQLAPGATVGSRHVIRPERGTVLARSGVDVLHGPIIVAPEGFYLEHPTHADVDCRLPGAYEVTYPRDLSAEELARRKD